MRCVIDKIILRGKITEDGKVELLDPIPDDFDRSRPVEVRLSPSVYEDVNEYGDRVIVDEENGIISPVEPLTTEELLNSPLVGLWKDHHEEIGSGLEFIKKLREEENERNDPWRGRSLS